MQIQDLIRVHPCIFLPVRFYNFVKLGELEVFVVL